MLFPCTRVRRMAPASSSRFGDPRGSRLAEAEPPLHVRHPELEVGRVGPPGDDGGEMRAVVGAELRFQRLGVARADPADDRVRRERLDAVEPQREVGGLAQEPQEVAEVSAIVCVQPGGVRDQDRLHQRLLLVEPKVEVPPPQERPQVVHAQRRERDRGRKDAAHLWMGLEHALLDALRANEDPVRVRQHQVVAHVQQERRGRPRIVPGQALQVVDVQQDRSVRLAVDPLQRLRDHLVERGDGQVGRDPPLLHLEAHAEEGYAAAEHVLPFHQPGRVPPEAVHREALGGMDSKQDAENVRGESQRRGRGGDPDRLVVGEHPARCQVGLQAIDEARLPEPGQALHQHPGAARSSDLAADPSKLVLAADEEQIHGIGGTGGRAQLFLEEWAAPEPVQVPRVDDRRPLRR